MIIIVILEPCQDRASEGGRQRQRKSLASERHVVRESHTQAITRFWSRVFSLFSCSAHVVEVEDRERKNSHVLSHAITGSQDQEEEADSQRWDLMVRRSKQTS